MPKRSREERFAYWLERIQRSRLPVREFLAKHAVPFGLTQYYRLQPAYERDGLEGLADGRSGGNHRFIHADAEGFLRWYVSTHLEVTQKQLREALKERYGIEITGWGLSVCLRRLGVGVRRAPKLEEVAEEWTPYAGVQLVVALAWYFGWPQATAKLIEKTMARARNSKRFASPGQKLDRRGRNPRGQFTRRYNRRSDVRRDRFESVERKRGSKSLSRMDLFKVSGEVLARRCLAVLSLPFVTHNGEIRTVDTAPGMALKTICGFQYKQATVAKFLAELKYLALSEDLLRFQVGFWQERWSGAHPNDEHLPLLCYYVDGNTKALWSSKRVKKNKVTMLGRVMGCLEQVFIHDGHGRPIYFETYSGHAPLGEHVLGLFEKIEDSLEGPGPKLPVERAIVMDAASNSVRTLRAFAAQKQYHYITSLDDNQWDFRKVRKEGRPQRYRFGPATLWDCEIELVDSSEKGYLFVTRAIKIEWDRGKETYLITSLPSQLIGASLVVKSYFDRWPDEELPFKIMKAVGCLHRVAGYGKQQLADVRVRKRQAELGATIDHLRARLHEPIVAVAELELRIANLIPKERRLRAHSKVIDGKRILPAAEAIEFRDFARRINALKSDVRAIRKEHQDFRKLEKAEREWIRLQGKETVYKVDVELDQIMTYFRVSLVNLYAHLSQLLGGSHLSLVRLLHTVLLLPGRIQETRREKRVILERNKKDLTAMDRLKSTIKAINQYGIRDGQGKQFVFSLN